MKTIIYQDSFITIVEDTYEMDGVLSNTSSHSFGGKIGTIVSKGMTRYWLYNSDMTIQYCHSGLYQKYGYKSLQIGREGIVKAEFTDDTWYLFNMTGKVLTTFPMCSVSDFQNGFAKVKYNKYCSECLLDHDGSLYLLGNQNKSIKIPQGYIGGFFIDNDHIGLCSIKDHKFYLFDGSLNPINVVLQNCNVRFNNFASLEKGPADWCVYMNNCSCFAYGGEKVVKCLFNLSTNLVCFHWPSLLDSSPIQSGFIFEPVGEECIRIKTTVDKEEDEWDSDDHVSWHYSSHYVSETLCFKNGAFFTEKCKIELVPDSQLILIQGMSYVIDNVHKKSNCGCITYSGDVLLPNIYSEIKCFKDHIEATLEDTTFQFTLTGEIVYQGSSLFKGIHAYEELELGKLLVRSHIGKWNNPFVYGILDANNKAYIQPLVFSSIKKVSSTSIIVCKDDKWGLINSTYSIVLNWEFESLEFISDDLFICSIKQDNMVVFGMINRAGQFVVHPTFCQISIEEGNLIRFERLIQSYHSDVVFYTDFELNTVASQKGKEQFTLVGFWQLEGSFNDEYCRFTDNNGKWGLVNKHSTISSHNKYDKISIIDVPNIFIGEIDGKYFLLNPQHNIEQQIDCDNCWRDNSCQNTDLIFISNENGTGLINLEGEIVLDCRYSLIYIYPDYLELNIDNLCGKADLKGNIIIPCRYESYRELDSGYYLAEKGDKLFLLSPYGNEVFASNELYNSFHETDAKCFITISVNEHGEYHYGIISEKGAIMRVPDLSYIGKYINGLAIANYGGRRTKVYNSDTGKNELFLDGGKFGVIDDCGRFVIEPLYDYIGEENNGYRVVATFSSRGKCFGIIKNDGTPVIECKYSYVRSIVEGLIVYAIGGEWSKEGSEKERLAGAIQDANRYLNGAKWGIMDVNEMNVVEPFADYMRLVSDGLITYRIGKKYGILNLENKTKQITEYDYLSSFYDGRCVAGVNLDSELCLFYGVINEKGDEVIPCEYDAVHLYDDGTIELVDGRTTIVTDYDGKILDQYSDEPKYDINDDIDWERETWYALTDGQYGDYPGPGVDYDFLGL